MNFRVESGFSMLNYIKNPIRNSLKVETVEQLLRVKFNGPDIEDFPFQSARESWISKGHQHASSNSKRKSTDKCHRPGPN